MVEIDYKCLGKKEICFSNYQLMKSEHDFSLTLSVILSEFFTAWLLVLLLISVMSLDLDFVWSIYLLIVSVRLLILYQVCLIVSSILIALSISNICLWIRRLISIVLGMI